MVKMKNFPERREILLGKLDKSAKKAVETDSLLDGLVQIMYNSHRVVKRADSSKNSQKFPDCLYTFVDIGASKHPCWGKSLKCTRLKKAFWFDGQAT